MDGLAGLYGVKTAGCAALLNILPGSPTPFMFPPLAGGIAPSVHGVVSDAALRAEFGRIAAGTSMRVPWMLRSSAIDETPGANESPSILFDPSDMDAGWGSFSATVRRLQNANPRLGITSMPMLGGWRTFAGGAEGFGYDLVSFVADTVNPLAPNEMHIAVVHGLGTQAVDSNETTILISVDRNTGKITFFGNKDARVLRAISGSMDGANSPESYRQKRIDFFDPVKGTVASRAFERSFFGFLQQNAYLVDGVLGTTHRDEFILGENKEWLGLIPFEYAASLVNLIGIMQYVHRELGPSQIEGAFLDRNARNPYLYQHITSPGVRRERRELRPLAPHLTSDRVLGSAYFEGPLVYYFGKQHAEDIFGDTGDLPNNPDAYYVALREIDRRFADTGYILVTGAHHQPVLANTPHCRYRLSTGTLNISSHAVTDARYKLAADPDADLVLAMNVKMSGLDEHTRSISGIAPDTRLPFAVAFTNAVLDSNGSQMVVEIRPPRPKEAPPPVPVPRATEPVTASSSGGGQGRRRWGWRWPPWGRE
jgi:hypothetical protein